MRRGFTLWKVPVGFIRTEEGRIEKTPDRQVQQAIDTVFLKFHQLGSARQATICFREEQIPLPHVKGGTAGKEVFWALPSSGRILQMLRNPCYGGAFAYGQVPRYGCPRRSRLPGFQLMLDHWQFACRSNRDA